MNNSPIGVFDSGLGGLTAVKELIDILPNENIVYFGDTARVPYGTRGSETLRRYVLEDVGILVDQGVKFILAACGTVSSVVDLQSFGLQVPIMGVIEVAVAAAEKATKNGIIGVLGTTATIRSNSYKSLLSSEFTVVQNPCPLFVPLVENGYLNESPITKLMAQEYLAPLIKANVDTVILGCTHFPLLAPLIQQIMGEVTLIDSGKQAALEVKKQIFELRLNNSTSKKGKIKYFVSDNTDNFEKQAGMFLGRKIDGQVEKKELGI